MMLERMMKLKVSLSKVLDAPTFSMSQPAGTINNKTMNFFTISNIKKPMARKVWISLRDFRPYIVIVY